MKRLFTLALVSLICLASCSNKEGKNDETKAEEIVANELPTMTVRMLDGKEIQTKELKGKTVLVLFQPDCDHCQHEAVAIEENLSAFRDYTLYFVSSAEAPAIKQFSNDYKLAGIPNVIFGSTTVQAVLDNFGPIQAPSIYIYSDNKELVQSFNGQTEIGEIMKYL